MKTANYKFYFEGKLAFQIVTIQYEYEEKGEGLRQLISSNLPEQVLKDTKRNYYNWLTSNHQYFIENSEQIINQLGNSLLHNFRARFFFYPHYLLQNNRLQAYYWKQIRMHYKGFEMLPGELYSTNHYPIKFYCLSMQFLECRFYIRSKFRKEVIDIARTEFESILSSQEMQKEYIENYMESNLFYKIRGKETIYYIMCQGFSPILIVVKGL